MTSGKLKRHFQQIESNFFEKWETGNFENHLMAHSTLVLHYKLIQYPRLMRDITSLYLDFLFSPAAHQRRSFLLYFYTGPGRHQSRMEEQGRLLLLVHF